MCMVEGQGGKEQCSFRTHAGAKSYCVRWKVRVGKNSVLFTQVPEPILFMYGGRVEKNSVLFAHVLEPNFVW